MVYMIGAFMVTCIIITIAKNMAESRKERQHKSADHPSLEGVSPSKDGMRFATSNSARSRVAESAVPKSPRVEYIGDTATPVDDQVPKAYQSPDESPDPRYSESGESAKDVPSADLAAYAADELEEDKSTMPSTEAPGSTGDEVVVAQHSFDSAQPADMDESFNALILQMSEQEQSKDGPERADDEHDPSNPKTGNGQRRGGGYTSL